MSFIIICPFLCLLLFKSSLNAMFQYFNCSLIKFLPPLPHCSYTSLVYANPRPDRNQTESLFRPMIGLPSIDMGGKKWYNSHTDCNFQLQPDFNAASIFISLISSLPQFPHKYIKVIQSTRIAFLSHLSTGDNFHFFFF